MNWLLDFSLKEVSFIWVWKGCLLTFHDSSYTQGVEQFFPDHLEPPWLDAFIFLIPNSFMRSDMVMTHTRLLASELSTKCYLEHTCQSSWCSLLFKTVCFQNQMRQCVWEDNLVFIYSFIQETLLSSCMENPQVCSRKKMGPWFYLPDLSLRYKKSWL